MTTRTENIERHLTVIMENPDHATEDRLHAAELLMAMPEPLAPEPMELVTARLTTEQFGALEQFISAVARYEAEKVIRRENGGQLARVDLNVYRGRLHRLRRSLRVVFAVGEDDS